MRVKEGKHLVEIQEYSSSLTICKDEVIIRKGDNLQTVNKVSFTSSHFRTETTPRKLECIKL